MISAAGKPKSHVKGVSVHRLAKRWIVGSRAATGIDCGLKQKLQSSVLESDFVELA